MKNPVEALQGEPVDIAGRGTKSLSTPSADGPKLARAVRRDALRGDPASIVDSDSKLLAKLSRG